MRFSWKALLLAPLPVPLLWSVFFIAPLSPDKRAYWFLLFFIPAAVVSYGATIVVALPGLYLLSKVAPLTLPRTCVLGAVLGTMSYVPSMLLLWLLMPGRPQMSFAEFLASVAGSDTVIFAIGGLVTAAAYWFLAGRRAPPQRP
jgi:hypothetical protein